MPTVKELRDQIATLQAELQTKLVAEREQVIASIKEQMAAYDISVDALIDKPAKAAKGPKKYKATKQIFRDPDSGNTWSGRGKPPRWIAGKDREQFRIHPA